MAKGCQKKHKHGANIKHWTNQGGLLAVGGMANGEWQMANGLS
jgi:hypothetical protein